MLLQDIYALMDLDRFALDPNASILLPAGKDFEDLTWDKRQRGGYPYTIFEYAEVEDHPYLHLFPGLKWTTAMAESHIKNADAGERGTFGYNPYNPAYPFYTDGPQTKTNFHPRDGNTHFIYHPWFEPLDAHEITGGTKLHRWRKTDEYEIVVENTQDPWNSRKYTHSPHWFGKNSTRGVLSEAVAEALAEAKKPGVEDHDMPMRIRHRGARKTAEYSISGWSLAEYLRTPMVVSDIKAFGNGYRGTKGHESYAYNMPKTQWEFLHPGLPIVRVTNLMTIQMPFRVPGKDTWHSNIAVSFVISFQNRWASFEDPNRWLFRFEEDMREIPGLYDTLPGGRKEFRQTQAPGILGGIDDEMHKRLFPRYWHSSDYMQHRIIGPVVVQVYEQNRKNDPLQAGIYHAYPKVAEWEAPGPILRDEQLRVTVESRREGAGSKDLMEIFRPEPGAKSPNPGWPLPGHVMTHPGTGPGTEAWEKFGMDTREW